MAAARVAFSSPVPFGRRMAASTSSNAVVSSSTARSRPAFSGLRALGERRRGCPRGLVPGLADRQVRDHGRERRAEAAGQRCRRAAARGRRVARNFVDEALDRHRHEGCGHPHSVLDDPLVGIEGRKLGEAQRLDGELHELALRQAGRPALLAQVVTAGLDQGLERRQADELGAGHEQAELRGFLARGFEDFVQRRRAISTAG